MYQHSCGRKNAGIIGNDNDISRLLNRNFTRV